MKESGHTVFAECHEFSHLRRHSEVGEDVFVHVVAEEHGTEGAQPFMAEEQSGGVVPSCIAS